MKTVAEVKYFPVGWIPGFRVWTLQAFDVNSKRIVEISKDYGSFGNEAKFEDFMYKLYEKGYRLTKDQIDEIKVKAKETIDRAKENIQKTMTALSKLFS